MLRKYELSNVRMIGGVTITTEVWRVGLVFTKVWRGGGEWRKAGI